MNLRRFAFAACISLFTLHSLFSTPLPAADRTDDWKTVAAAQQKGQPQTASAALDQIIASAISDAAYPEALRAILIKTQVDASTENYRTQAAAQIRALTAYLSPNPPITLPTSLRPLLEAALAKQWWNYYQQNRWQLLQRTQTAESPSDDFLTWDARRVLAETANHFEAALADPAALQRTPIATLEPLLAAGALPDTYRPTLYDFLVHEAIAFYSAGEQGIAKSEDAFEPTADSPILGTLEEFLAWNPGNAEPQLGPSDSAHLPPISPALRAIQLYQQLLRTHLADPLPRLALADAELARINWVAGLLGEPARARHLTALRAFVKQYAKSAPPVAAVACASLAELLQNDDPAAAHAAAKRGIKLTSEGPAAARCHNIISTLEAPSLQNITTENTWLPAAAHVPASEITVNYRNLKKIHFRAIPRDYATDAPGDSSDNTTAQTKALLTKTPAKAWTSTLPDTPDYRYRTEKLAAPRDLEPGYYYLIASLDENFTEKENIISIISVWVSNLALIIDADRDTKLSGYVLNATTGEPIANATVTAKTYTGYYSNRKQITLPPLTTDSNGAFIFESVTDKEGQNYLVHARAPDGQCVASAQPTYVQSKQTPDRNRAYIYFFTDRAIYRPGQAIQFKAVILNAHSEKGNYKLLTKHRVTIAIDDPNGKEVARLELTTNDYGSISGNFIVPAGRLTGQYALHTIGAENGRSYIHVEEYKRPKFEVTLPAPATAPKLNAETTLTGTATAYTGAPIDGAKVIWRVQRLVRWPRWCWWPMPTTGNREIAHGTATTDAGGKFTITFTALADKTADPKNEPVFNYFIATEVTDNTGETRTAARTISVGYTALAADITADEWQITGTPVALKLNTATLDGIPQGATGTIAIHALKQPDTVPQPALADRRSYYRTPSATPAPNPADPRQWPEARLIEKKDFTTDPEKGLAIITTQLPAGIYRALVTTKDRFGKSVTARTEIRVYAPDAANGSIKEPLNIIAPTWTAAPGQTFTALLSSGYDTSRALVSIEQNRKIIRRYWTDEGATQHRINIPVTESMRGGIMLRVFQVRDNRLVTKSEPIDIPWDNKQLKITWEHFNSKLIPGGRETWTARITGPDAERTAAEFTATLYDASLDQIYPHQWHSLIGAFRQNQTWYSTWESVNSIAYFSPLIHDLYPTRYHIASRPLYRTWNNSIELISSDVIALDGFSVSETREGSYAAMSMAAPAMKVAARAVPAGIAQAEIWSADDASGIAPPSLMDVPGSVKISDAPAPDLTTVTARKNLNETAFFFPQLLTDSDGTVRIEFTAPEALTRWKFLGFAHDKQLRSALLTDTAVTAKDLMVQPNPPRFLREGDTVEFTVKITNTTDKPQTGAAQLTFADASTLEPVNIAGNAEPQLGFSLSPNSSQTLSWRITIPDGQGFLTYKAVASTGTVSDGEEGFLPVLIRRQLVTESIALPIRDKGTYTFRFDKLADTGTAGVPPASGNAGKMPALPVSESLTVQMTSNPAWYAVLALPSLMEYPYECSEQIFNRYYANALAAHIANSDPKIARVFEQWRNTPALDSPLLKNEDLKSVLIEETPWLRAATRESEQRRAIGQLFDVNRTTAQTASIIATLAERQGSDGLWPWFPGGRGSEYITRYLVAGFARLRHFGITPDPRADAMIKRAIPALDAALAKRHADLLASPYYKPDANNLTTSDVYQLYTRSFFAKENPIPSTARAAYDYFLEQTRQYWTQLPRQSQGHAALALHRADFPGQAQLITTSLKQRAKNHDELGMYWADTERGWFWWQAPVETQSLMIEVFDEVARDAQAVSDLQLWLLKQKQTQAWPSTKATADAVYALLLRGTEKLASDDLVNVSLGDKKIEPAKTEVGTGFYTERIPGPSVMPAMGEKITVTKTDAGPAWGSVTWRYFQSIDAITPHEGTPLTLKKTIYKQINTASGPTLVSLSSTTLNPGDTLIVRIELRTDRDMEFVHLKDQRGSGTEPVNVLSGYRWKNSLGYYESTRDTATHFFMDYLNAGTYVFEYPIRVQLRGRYESGIAEIQCMYAPEYNSHSASTTLNVE